MNSKTTDCPYKVRFSHRNGNVLELAQWCRDHCSGDYFYQYTAPVFHFENEIDATMFRLKV